MRMLSLCPCLFMVYTMAMGQTDNPEQQSIDSTYQLNADSSLVDNPYSNWFKGGNIDFISSGLLRSTANVFVLNLGDPDKFHVPFYLLIGATTDVLQDDITLNEIVVSDLLNDKGGFINFGLDGKSKIKAFGEHSDWFLTYLLGAKSITGVNMEVNKNESFLSMIGNLGMQFQTAAWALETPERTGKAWFKYFFSVSKNNSEKMQALFGDCTSSILFGANIEGGIDLKDLVKISFGYYKYMNNRHLELFDQGLFKFSADFVLGK